uniref:DUF3615 domain-containing protein n=2 Tax=Aegilops tauschii subsp. strangulata TaxID=200361 RepID=A0A453AWY8_AEGTS
CSPPAPALGWQQGCKPARRPAFRPICGLERVPKYELHLICGVNKYVDGPVYTGPFTRIYHYSHINFLATKSAGAPPTLFFAECRNDGTQTQEMGWCCPVDVPSPGTGMRSFSLAT